MKVSIETLFGSRRKIALLRALYSAEGAMTAAELAGRSKVSLPQVGRILRKFVGDGIVEVGIVYAADVYSLGEARKILRPVFECEGLSPERTAQSVITSLLDLGAPSSIAREKVQPMRAEEALAYSVRFARHDPALLSTLPVIIVALRKQHPDQKFWQRVADEARKQGVDRHLGMILALSAQLLHDRTLEAHAARMKRRLRKPKQLSPFRGWFQTSWERSLAEKKTPAVAREWGFLMNTSESDFAHHLKIA